MMTRTQAQPEAQARTRTPKPSPARGLGAWRLILALGASYFMLKSKASVGCHGVPVPVVGGL